MTLHTDRIEIDPRVCGGKPVIKGTRIPVSMLVDQLAEGESWSKLLAGYPELTVEDIRAALHFASSSVEQTEFAEAAVG